MSERICTIDGCSEEVRCKGLCNPHYRKSRRPPRPTTAQRYEAKIDRSGGPEACHPWTNCTNEHGYGKFSHDGETLANRWGYKHYVGPLSRDEVVRHTCDNPACQNQDHWVKGTQADNIRDAMSRSRQHRPRGERNVRAKLTESEVRQIRRDHAAGLYRNNSEAAARYGVSQPTISQILRRDTWRHLE